MSSETHSPMIDDHSFNRFVATLMASITVLAAVVGLLQSDASARGDHANRAAQQFALEAMERRGGGAVQTSYDYFSAFQTWDQLDVLALRTEIAGDIETANRYRTVRDRIVQLSPLLQEPYFTSEGGYPHYAAYEADIYMVAATALTERYLVAAALGNAWDGKANAYVTHLTLLAVTLFLYGLSLTTNGRMRWLFVGSGSFLSGLVLLWMLVVIFWPVPVIADQAIDIYAEGVGLTYRGDLVGAVAAFDQALTIDGRYGTAYYERGNAYYLQGNYPAAAADYQAAKANGRDDSNASWSLGWTYYLMGHFDEAIGEANYGLSLDSSLIGVHLNLGLALLADGRIEEAQNIYNQTIMLAAQQVADSRANGQEPPFSLWYYLDAGARDLESLVDQLNGQPHPWTEAPPSAALANPDAIVPVAEALFQQLKSSAVALEFTGRLPLEPPAVHTSPFEFGQNVYDEQGDFQDYDISDTFPFGTDEVIVVFEYEGFQGEPKTLWKVYRDGIEDPSWRFAQTWSLGESGRAEKPLSYAYGDFYVFGSGEYVVELYVNSHLVQRGAFTVTWTP